VIIIIITIYLLLLGEIMLNRSVVLAAALTAFGSSAMAEEFTVKLLTSGANSTQMIMEPGYIKIAKGDTVNFVPSDGSHNAQSFFTPEGATPFVTPFGQPTKVVFNQEGVYLYKCLPHAMMGMLGVVQVGAATNLDQAKKAWQSMETTVVLNKDRMGKYLAEVK
jgi:pseudoazurin